MRELEEGLCRNGCGCVGLTVLRLGVVFFLDVDDVLEGLVEGSAGCCRWG
jgi:hypothetical protein